MSERMSQMTSSPLQSSVHIKNYDARTQFLICETSARITERMRSLIGDNNFLCSVLFSQV